MTPGNELSMFDVALECLGKIWSPGAEAARLQAESNARSLEETIAAAERAGCKVYYVDLPEKVSGFAEIIEGQACIVLNRAKPRINLEYTLPHELGHQVLHLNPSRDTGRSEFSAMRELEADLFAATWIMWSATGGRQDEMLLKNPEASTTVFMSLFAALLLVLVALVVHIGSKLLPGRHPALPEAR